MVKVAGITLGLLIGCCGAALASPNSENTDSAQAGVTMSKSKKDNSNSASRKTESSVKPFNGREDPDWVYHLSQAQWHARTLRENTMIKVAKAIEERGWNQTQAAKFLGVSQPRISDLMRGQSGKFTLDSLVEMLYALDQPVKLVLDSRADWGLSSPSPQSEKDLEDQVAFFTTVVKQDPKDAKAYRKRGDAYDDLKKYELAIGDYTRCIELDPKDYGARTARVNAYRDSGQYQASINECDEMMRLFPERSQYQNRGITYEMMGEYDKALADHTKAIELDPQRPGPWWNRAGLYVKLGKLKEAISDYESTLKADPTYKIAQVKIDELKKKITEQ